MAYVNHQSDAENLGVMLGDRIKMR